MHRRPNISAMIAGGVTVVLAAFSLTLPAGAASQPVSQASVALPSVVSQTPVSWTPNVSATTTVGQSGVCNSTYFGSQCQSEVYDTAYVNGDIIASGAFTEACQPGTYAQGLCAPGTQVTRDDIFAYAASTGKIDPNFVPVLNAGPAWAVTAGPNNTVYVGGAFTTVDGASHKGLVQLNVNPGVTSGATADGSIVTAFKGTVNNEARDLSLSPDGTALYVGGQFTAVDGVTGFSGLARLNATTGANDSSFAFTLSDPISGLPIKIEAMALSTDGTHLAFSGTALEVNGQSRPRLAVIDTGTTFGATASLSDWTAPILANNCSAEHDYVRGLAFSSDGTFIATANTGYQNDGSMAFSTCDSVARFDVNAANTTTTGTSVDVAPAWIDYGGGDSFYSVTIAGNTVYAGGHSRWQNNYCGNNNACEQNALLITGVGAFDANTGLGIAWWHPQTLRGAGTMYMATFPAGTYDGSKAGLIIGTDVDEIAGTYHSEQAIFPVAPTTSSTPGGPIPSGIFNEDNGQYTGAGQNDGNTGAPMCIDDADNSSVSGSPADLANCVNEAEQNWTINSNGTIEVNGLCLDLAAGGTVDGTPIVLNTCDSSATQQWTQGAGNDLVNAAATTANGTPYCLDDPDWSTTNPTQLDLWICNGGSNQVWPLPSTQGPPTTNPVGQVWPDETQSNSQVPCLDDYKNLTSAGNKVQLYTCTGDTEQKWTIVPVAATPGSFTVQVDGNYCLDSSAPTTPGSQLVVLNPCNGSTTQDWTVSADGRSPGNELVNTGATTLNASPYCLDDPGFTTTNGEQMQLYSCNAGTNQTWNLPVN